MKPITLPSAGWDRSPFAYQKLICKMQLLPERQQPLSPPPCLSASPQHPAPRPAAPTSRRTLPSAGRSRPRDGGRWETVAPLHCAAQGGRATGPDPSLWPVVAQRVWNKSPLHQNVPPLAETAVCSRCKGPPPRYPPSHSLQIDSEFNRRFPKSSTCSNPT